VARTEADCQRLLEKVQAARLSIRLVQQHGASRMQRVATLTTKKQNIERLLAFLRKTVADPKVMRLLQSGKGQYCSKIASLE
jgi:hypothetical protein